LDISVQLDISSLHESIPSKSNSTASLSVALPAKLFVLCICFVHCIPNKCPNTPIQARGAKGPQSLKFSKNNGLDPVSSRCYCMFIPKNLALLLYLHKKDEHWICLFLENFPIWNSFTLLGNTFTMSRMFLLSPYIFPTSSC